MTIDLVIRYLIIENGTLLNAIEWPKIHQFVDISYQLNALFWDDFANIFIKIMICPKYSVQDCLGKNLIRICLDF